MKVVTLLGSSEDRELLVGMHKLRTRVFRDRMGWSVRTIDGLEVDEFDRPQTRYILVVADGEVLGCARFLDFSGPTMIGTTFSHLIDRPVAGFAVDSIESSRFCVDTEKMRSWSSAGRGLVTANLVSGMIAWAALHQYRSIVTVTDVAIERLLRRLGLSFHRLGTPQKLERTNAVAGLVPVSAHLAEKVLPPPEDTPPSSGIIAA